MTTSDWVLFAGLEAVTLLGGVYGTLVGYRVIRGTTADPAAYEAWYARSGRWLRYLGPLCLAIAATLPVAFDLTATLPRWVGGGALGLVVAAFAIFMAATWRPGPKVPWPSGILGWLELGLSGLCFGAALSGAAASLGLPPSPAVEALCFVQGLIAARLITVWSARFTHRVGGRPIPRVPTSSSR